MEFVAKKKKLKITIEGQSWEISCPTIGEQELLNEKLSAAEPKAAFSIYAEYFSSLGMPLEALKSLDADDFLELTTFIFSPKKNLTKPV